VEDVNLVDVLEDLRWGMVGDTVIRVFVEVDGEGRDGRMGCGGGGHL